jgi:3-dehydroquinate dehydratase-2
VKGRRPPALRCGGRPPSSAAHREALDRVTAKVETMCREAAADDPVVFRQSNAEADLIVWIHEAIDEAGGIVINPAAYTFTSMAIMDALKMFPGPIIEVHISNIHRREAIYHRSYVSGVATAVIAGLGVEGYRVAIAEIRRMVALS